MSNSALHQLSDQLHRAFNQCRRWLSVGDIQIGDKPLRASARKPPRTLQELELILGDLVPRRK